MRRNGKTVAHFASLLKARNGGRRPYLGPQCPKLILGVS